MGRATKTCHIFSLFIICSIIIFFCSPESNGESVRPANHKEFPFVVSIGFRYKTIPVGKQLCSGTVITNKHVITAANCLTGKVPREIQIFAGCHEITDCDQYDVYSWLTYNEWAASNERPAIFEYFDIAIVQLETKFDESKVEPVLLSPKPLKNFYGFVGILAGWANVNDKSKPKIIQTTSVRILTKKECKSGVPRSSASWVAFEDEKTLCTESDSFFKHASPGGPILYGRNIFIGVNLKTSLKISTATKHKKLNFHEFFKANKRKSRSKDHPSS